MITKEIAEREFKKYVEVFGLDRWEMVVAFNPSNADVYGEVVCEPEYHRAEILLNLNKLDSLDVLRKTIVHEILHVVLSPMTNAAKVFAGDHAKVLEDLEDSVVTHVEKLSIWYEEE